MLKLLKEGNVSMLKTKVKKATAFMLSAFMAVSVFGTALAEASPNGAPPHNGQEEHHHKHHEQHHEHHEHQHPHEHEHNDDGHSTGEVTTAAIVGAAVGAIIAKNT